MDDLLLITAIGLGLFAFAKHRQIKTPQPAASAARAGAVVTPLPEYYRLQPIEELFG